MYFLHVHFLYFFSYRFVSDGFVFTHPASLRIQDVHCIHTFYLMTNATLMFDIFLFAPLARIYLAAVIIYQ